MQAKEVAASSRRSLVHGIHNATKPALLLSSNDRGSSFDQTSDKYVHLIHGQLVWFLFPPDTKPRPRWGGDIKEWINEVYFNLDESKKPEECIQASGELIYIPEGCDGTRTAPH